MAMRPALISLRVSAAVVSPVLPVTELAMLWQAFKLSAKSLLSLVWNSWNSDLVTVLVLPILELSLRGLLDVGTVVASAGKSVVDSGSKTKWIFGLLRLVENLGTDPLSLIATVFHALACIDWIDWSSSSNPEMTDSLLLRRGR